MNPPWLAHYWFQRVGPASDKKTELFAWRLYQRLRHAVSRSQLTVTPIGRVAESIIAAVDVDNRVRKVLADVREFNLERQAAGDLRRIDAGLAWLIVPSSVPTGVGSQSAATQMVQGQGR